MLDLILRTLQRIGLMVGLLFIGAPLVVGGMKYYEHSTYAPTQATVLALSTKCEMAYKTSRYRSNERVVDCSEVADVKARYPEIDWTVTRVPFVDLSYTTPSGQPIRATARLGKLERTTAIVGEQIPILQSRNNPGLITGPANARFVRILSLTLIAGIALFAASRGIKWLRTRGLQEQPDPLRARKSALMGEPPESRSPTVETPRRQWRTSMPSHPPQFGAR